MTSTWEKALEGYVREVKGQHTKKGTHEEKCEKTLLERQKGDKVERDVVAAHASMEGGDKL